MGRAFFWDLADDRNRVLVHNLAPWPPVAERPCDTQFDGAAAPPTQSLLMVLCVVGMDISNLGEEMLFFYIAICVTAIVSFMVYEQIDNHFSALKTFSHGVLSRSSEGILSLFIVLGEVICYSHLSQFFFILRT